MFAFAAQAECAPRDLSQWSAEQKSAYRTVAARFQEEAAAYYSLLALGLVGSCKLALLKSTLNTENTLGRGITL